MGENHSSKFKLEDGISVIIPTHKREHLISQCLDALNKQTLSKELFEVIVIMNGTKDNTEEVIQTFKQNNKMGNIKLLDIDIGSASLARNLGINKASKKYTLFLDDDDFLSPNYLEQMLRYAAEATVVVSQIVNIATDGKENNNNTINLQIKHYADKNKVDYTQIDKVATINACKLIPTRSVKKHKFNPELKSGEDIVFFTELFLAEDLNIKIIPIDKQVIYYRLVSPNSISRQEMSFDFYVKQRLEVICILDGLLQKLKSKSEIRFVKSKITAQFLFINNYYLSNKHEKEQIMNLVEEYRLTFIPYQLNDNIITKLKYYTRKFLKMIIK